MKVAVASESDSRSGKVSSKAGRAPFYLIFEDGELVETWKNEYAEARGGAGRNVPEELDRKGVDKVLAGNFGGNMETKLKQLGIAYSTVGAVDVEETVELGS
ncbi:MAG: hypothetical protein MUP58_00255 [Candidatus Nanohaloarchaeota archaeon QJJ-9]|nr:hypothetical protein [Candidatus Nanohaloarchaeota archaeon QJJ-9]